MSNWLLLQLADAAFPTGGFAHSAGLEAAIQLAGREFFGLRAFAESALWQAGHGVLPFVRAAHECPERAGEIDARCDAFLSNHVANAASRTQGRAFASTCARVFDVEIITAIDAAIRARATPGHHAPALGAVTRALGLALHDAQSIALHGTLRQVMSSAVRLGISGPLEAQKLQHALAPWMDRVLSQCGGLGMNDAAQTAPILDLFGSLHDRLAARMFVS